MAVAVLICNIYEHFSCLATLVTTSSTYTEDFLQLVSVLSPPPNRVRTVVSAVWSSCSRFRPARRHVAAISLLHGSKHQCTHLVQLVRQIVWKCN